MTGTPGAPPPAAPGMGIPASMAAHAAAAALPLRRSFCARDARAAILSEWNQDPELKGATIDDITLAYKSGKMYAGFVDATIGGELVRFSLEVSVEDDSLEIAWQPIDE